MRTRAIGAFFGIGVGLTACVFLGKLFGIHLNTILSGLGIGGGIAVATLVVIKTLFNKPTPSLQTPTPKDYEL
ncbi:MAG: hypothetical protein AAF267_02225 [Deinococcota bacterium]